MVKKKKKTTIQWIFTVYTDSLEYTIQTWTWPTVSASVVKINVCCSQSDLRESKKKKKKKKKKMMMQFKNVLPAKMYNKEFYCLFI